MSPPFSFTVNKIFLLPKTLNTFSSPSLSLDMWSSGGDDNNNRVSSSSSKSSSSSSHSPFSTPSILPNSRRKTMEEVWKDITLTSPNVTHSTRGVEIGIGGRTLNPNSKRNSFRGINLQEFLAKPFDKENPTPPPPPPISVVTTNSTAGDDIINNIFGSTPSSTTTQVCPAPPTVLSLNTVPDFLYLDNNDPVLRSNPRLDHHCNGDLASSFVASLNSPFDPFAAASSLSPFCKKRVSDSDENTGDRRHKRMIKNRESAARSRARKQAYAYELELEVATLAAENESLKKQQRQLYLAATAQLAQKATLHRTSTAPF